jgi:hypothetical protein
MPNACDAVVEFRGGGGGEKLAALLPCPVFPFNFLSAFTPNNAVKPNNAIVTVGLRVPCPGGLRGWAPPGRPCRRPPHHPLRPDTRLLLGVFGLLIGPLRVAPFNGLLKTSLIIGFDTGTRSGHRFAIAVGHGAVRASCGEGRNLLVGHAG